MSTFMRSHTNANSIIALSKLYELKDPRLAEVQVKGELIPNADGRIMTRARARQSKPSSHSTFPTPNEFVEVFFRQQRHHAREQSWEWGHPPKPPSIHFLFETLHPFAAAFTECASFQHAEHDLTKPSTDPDQYTIIPSTLKILKYLVAELASASGNGIDAATAADLAEEGSNDDDWEDEPNPFLDLNSSFSKEQLMAFAAEDVAGSGRTTDDETHNFLVDFFKRAAGSQGFPEEFQALSEQERMRLQESAS